MKKPQPKKVTSKVKQPTANSIQPVAYKPTKEEIQREKEWQAKDDIDTLKRAEEIMADKARLEAAKQHAQKTIKSLDTIAKKK